MDLWARLASHREVGMSLAPFSWRDFDSFCKVTGESLSEVDLVVLAAIEDEFFDARREAEERRRKIEDRKHGR